MRKTLLIVLLLIIGCSQETDVSYHDNGQKKSELIYKDKKLVKSTWWYENGQKKSEGKFEDDKKYDLWKDYYENCKLQEERNYKEEK